MTEIVILTRNWFNVTKLKKFERDRQIYKIGKLFSFQIYEGKILKVHVYSFILQNKYLEFLIKIFGQEQAVFVCQSIYNKLKMLYGWPENKLYN